MERFPLYVAPLEGLTGWYFRQVHAKMYPGVTRYYTPFLSPVEEPGLTPRAMREVAPQNNEGFCLVPQLLTNRADYFLNAAVTLEQLGYREVNLNLGCPSGTVVSKGKASGMLNDPDSVDRLLDAIFSKSPLPISIKTRIGRYDASEIVPLMEVYNRYPIAELTVHPRIRGQMYRGKPDMESFAYVMSCAKMPICYNGDLFTVSDCEAILSRYPRVSALMLGRGVMANPGLISEVRGKPRTDRTTLCAFHDAMLARTSEVLSGDRHILQRMKEIWFYLIFLFENSESYGKRIRKCSRLDEYRAIVDGLFVECEIGVDCRFMPPTSQEI